MGLPPDGKSPALEEQGLGAGGRPGEILLKLCGSQQGPVLGFLPHNVN